MGSISGSGRDITASWNPGEMSRVVSQNSSKLGCRRTSSTSSISTSVKPASAISSAKRSASPSVNGPGACSAPGGGPDPALGQLLARERSPRVALDRVPHGGPQASAGGEHAPRLGQRRGRVHHQHVAPAAEDDVHARDRQVDPFAAQDLEADVRDPELGRPFTGALEHPLGLVGDHHLPARGDQLGRQQAGLPESGRQLEDPLAGLGGDRLHQPLGDGGPEGVDLLPPAAPAVGRGFPVVEARLGGSRPGPRSSELPAAGACPSVSSAAAWATARSASGPCRGRAPSRSGPAAPPRSPARRRPRRRAAPRPRSPPRPTGRPARRTRPPRAPRGDSRAPTRPPPGPRSRRR